MRISRRNKHTHVGVAAAIVMTSGIAAVAADWPQLRGDTQRTGVSAETIKPPLAVLWRAVSVIWLFTSFFLSLNWDEWTNQVEQRGHLNLNRICKYHEVIYGSEIEFVTIEQREGCVCERGEKEEAIGHEVN